MLGIINRENIVYLIEFLIFIFIIWIALIFVKYFVGTKSNHYKPISLLIVYIMVASFLLNFLLDKNIYTAFYNMIGVFFGIDVEITQLNNLWEPLYYFIKLAAVISTFYLVIVKFFDSFKKERRIKNAIKHGNYFIYFSEGPLKEYIEKQFKGVAINADELGDKCFDYENYFIAYNDDKKNMVFYCNNFCDNKKTFKNITLLINNFEHAIFKEDGYSILNFTEQIAKDFWLNCVKLYSYNFEHKIIVCIIDLNEIGRNILKFGLLNNIYSVNQRIIYKVWGDKNIFDSLNIDLKSISNDEMYYMGSVSESISDESVKIIENADICIINNWDFLVFQEIVFKAYNLKNIWIYYQDVDEQDISTLFADAPFNGDVRDSNDNAKNKRINFFGKLRIYDWMMSAHYETDIAKDINCYYQGYGHSDKNKLWKTSDIFTRKTCLAKAQYKEMSQKLLKPMEDEEERELQHIHWCRFMMMEGWRYGEVIHGIKDCKNKIHPDLVSNSKLKIDEKRKYDYIIKFGKDKSKEMLNS